MKILYFSDSHAYNVMGIKRSLEEEVRRRGHEVLFISQDQIINVLFLIEKYSPDQIWLAHSSLILPEGVKTKIKIPIVGFGFSDPYYFKESRFNSYDVYITNYYETYKKYKNVIPMHYNPISCDFTFHKKSKNDIKNIDVSMIGQGVHIRFRNKEMRLGIVDLLRRDLPELKICCYGNSWNSHPNNYSHVEGDAFINIIHWSKLGLDFQEDYSPLAHRIFEYIACGTPIITRDRPEVHKMFVADKEILVYTDYTDLENKIRKYTNPKNKDKLAMITQAGYDRCVKEHDIKYRVDGILGFIEGGI